MLDNTNRREFMKVTSAGLAAAASLRNETLAAFWWFAGLIP
jgi:hypothetical protein